MGDLDGLAFDPVAKTLALTGSFHGTHEVSVPGLTYPETPTVICDTSIVEAAKLVGAMRFDCTGETITVTPSTNSDSPFDLARTRLSR